MGTATTTLTVNAAFLQEIKEDHVQLQRALGQLKAHLGRPRPYKISIRWLNDLLSELRDRLAIHFSLEETFGYFEDAISVAPHLSQRADHLHGQHADLFRTVCGLVECSEQLVYGECAVDSMRDLVDRCLEFHGRFCRHEHEENELILQAFDEDIGVGD